MTSVVFSRDRAAQLDAFLRSYADNVDPVGEVQALYSVSSPRHAAAYAEVFALHPFAVPRAERRRP